MFRRTAEWIEDRTGLGSLARRFLDEQIPASAGWPQVLGSVALFLFLVQAFTGILLAINYAPAPGDAYWSVRHIITELTAGRLIRNLHHWGASMLIAVVVLHMVQVLLYGAYRRPRETTWVAGVALLLLTLGYGLTGYLLPWDNRAYWGTVVSTQIAAGAPLIGPVLARLLGAAAGGVGVVTFARFYALHVLLLPPATALLIVLHVYLVRRHGITPAPGDFRPKVSFFPRQAFKDTLAIFAAFGALFVMAVVADAPLDGLADPTNSAYVPRPEWYFMFLFELLRIFEGPLEILASFVLPAAAITALLALPFLDRGRLHRLTRRTTAVTAVTFAALCWAGLTLAAVMTTPEESVSASNSADWQRLPPAELARGAPDAPDFAVSAARSYERHHCSMCHLVNGAGRRVGPALNGVSSRRSREWLVRHFADPKSVSPGSIMPAYHFGPKEMDEMVSYLLALP